MDARRLRVLHKLPQGLIVGYSDGSLGFVTGLSEDDLKESKLIDNDVTLIGLPNGTNIDSALDLRFVRPTAGENRLCSEDTRAAATANFKTILLDTPQGIFRFRAAWTPAAKVWLLDGKAELLFK